MATEAGGTNLDSLFNGAFTLPDSETDTETETDTDKLTQNAMEICVDVHLYAVRAPPHKSVQASFYRSRGGVV